MALSHLLDTSVFCQPIKDLPLVDLLIVATARTHGLVVATLNAKHFLGIPGLRVEDWGRA